MLLAAFKSLLASCNPQLVAYMVPARQPFWLISFYLCGRDLFHCSLGGRGGIQVHPTGFALGQVQIKGCELRSRHMLWSRQRTYIQPIVLQEGVCTHHPLFCVSLTPARLLHSYVCPSIYMYIICFDVLYWFWTGTDIWFDQNTMKLKYHSKIARIKMKSKRWWRTVHTNVRMHQLLILYFFCIATICYTYFETRNQNSCRRGNFSD